MDIKSVENFKEMINEEFMEMDSKEEEDSSLKISEKSDALKSDTLEFSDAVLNEDDNKNSTKQQNSIFTDKDTRQKSLKCPNCSKTYRILENYQQHLRCHLAVYHPYECEECLESFSQKQYLSSHMERHKGSKSYTCSQCSEKCSTMFSLNRHNLTHFRDPPYPCCLCDASFPTVAIRSRHMKNHVISCGLCKIPFQYHWQLRDHIFEEHRSKNLDEKGKFIEAIQDDPFQFPNNENDLDTSSENNVNNKVNLQCFICEQLFPSKDACDTHLKAHKVFMCTHCPKFFAQPFTLREHESKHTGIHPYKCEICGIICNRNEFKRHKRKCKKERNQYEASHDIMTIVANSRNISAKKSLKRSLNCNADCNIVDTVTEVIKDFNTSDLNRSSMHFTNSKADNLSIGSDLPNLQKLDSCNLPNLDLNSYSHLTWLSGFVEKVNSMKYPLEHNVYKQILHALETLYESLYDPEGELKNPNNFSYLMTFQQQLSTKLTEHLKHSLEQLPKI